MTRFRTKTGGRVDRNQPVSFTFDDTVIQGYRGDTVASALLASGRHLVGRSFKYHRPRGVLTAGPEEPNALLGVTYGPGRFTPNTRATVQEIYPGLVTESQNAWPALGYDLGAVNDLLHPLFSAGFYYKTFKWPRAFWDRLYEPVIRAAAGLGRPPRHRDPDSYTARYLHTDLLVVGGGPAGLAAARQGAAAGLRVTLVDEQSEMGGSLLSHPDALINGASAWTWLADTMAALRAKGVQILPRTTAFGYYHQNKIGLCERMTDHLEHRPEGMPRERLWRVRAKRVVLAQGGLERPLMFQGNDRPGVMLAGAAQTYFHRYGVRVGSQAVVVTSHDSAYRTAIDLSDAGTPVAAIIDLRPAPDPELTYAAAARGIEVLAGHTVTETYGRSRIVSVRVNPVRDGLVGAERWIPCDCLLMSGGWTPSVHLFSHTQGRLNVDPSSQMFLPGATQEACQVAGAGRGLWGLAAALEDGTAQGKAAVTALGATPTRTAPLPVAPERDETGVLVGELPTDRKPGKVRAFVDFQNDVTSQDIRLALQEGMQSIEHVKRYTTTGMATDQGKLSNLNALKVAADTLDRPMEAVGLTSFRPPYTPVGFGALAGHRRGREFAPTRKTPIDSWAAEQGAVFEPVGQWRRAQYFPKPGENREAAALRECRATRESVGMLDASTLGKIEVVGPDAATFLTRLYTNDFSTLKPGRCRYGLLLGEDGFIRDDGIVGRLAENRFHVTTTTGGAAHTLHRMEDYRQTEWPDLRVWLTSTTEHWAVIALGGPNARHLLAPLVTGLEIGAEAFPPMAVAECRVADFPARLFRTGFTGELGFEINVPAGHGRALWEQLMAAGAAFDLCPYGTEAMHIMRAEKGFLLVGQDTDGTVTPADAGLGWTIGKHEADFVGCRSLQRPDLRGPNRKQLVGLLTEDGTTVLEPGAQIVNDPDQPLPMTMIGHVTSAYPSAAAGRPIALALLAAGRDRVGDRVHIPMPDRVIAATVTKPVFYDPHNARLHL